MKKRTFLAGATALARVADHVENRVLTVRTHRDILQSEGSRRAGDHKVV